MKILFLSRWFPYPADNGSKLRIYNLLKGLSRKHSITLLSFAERPDADPCRPEIQTVCSEAYAVRWEEFEPSSLKARLGLLSSKPRSIIDTYSPEMAGKISRILKEDDYDLVIASQLPMAAYHPSFNGVPSIFEELELGSAFAAFRRAEIDPKGLRDRLTWLKLQNYLGSLLPAFRAVTVVSELERELLSRLFPFVRTVHVIPNCLDLSNYQTSARQFRCNRLIYTGSFRYHANHEAMCWFVEKVFPLVLEQSPETELMITGDHAGLSLPSQANITLAGYVENVRNLVADSAVAIAPLLSGGGTRLKILEAMALGTPVAATSKGAEGLDVRHDVHLLIADEPSVLANHILRLLGDESLRWRLAESARLLVQEKYDWRAALPDFETFLESLVLQRMSIRN